MWLQSFCPSEASSLIGETAQAQTLHSGTRQGPGRPREQCIRVGLFCEGQGRLLPLPPHLHTDLSQKASLNHQVATTLCTWPTLQQASCCYGPRPGLWGPRLTQPPPEPVLLPQFCSTFCSAHSYWERLCIVQAKIGPWHHMLHCAFAEHLLCALHDNAGDRRMILSTSWASFGLGSRPPQ